MANNSCSLLSLLGSAVAELITMTQVYVCLYVCWAQVVRQLLGSYTYIHTNVIVH